MQPPLAWSGNVKRPILAFKSAKTVEIAKLLLIAPV